MAERRDERGDVVRTKGNAKGPRPIPRVVVVRSLRGPLAGPDADDLVAADRLDAQLCDEGGVHAPAHPDDETVRARILEVVADERGDDGDLLLAELRLEGDHLSGDTPAA